MSQDARQLFLDKLKESGISEAIARGARFKVLSAQQTATLWQGAPRQTSLQIPYLDPTGKPTGFYRVRMLGTLNGFPHQLTKPLRYLQPPQSGVQVYFPHVATINWINILKDPNLPIVITEGELKALAATASDFATLGLGGVDSYRSKAALLPDLELIPWQGRKVYICYDSDSHQKPQVAAAALRLAEALGALGALVFDATLPKAATKIGLDDYLLLHGAKAFSKHLAAAEEYTTVKELHGFNTRFVFVRSFAKVYEEPTRHFHESTKFVNAVEANAIYTIVRQTPQGPKTEKRNTAKDWMAWPNRRAVHGVTYQPGSEELILTNCVGNNLNLWPGWGTVPKKGDVALWLKLFKYLTSNEDDVARKWFQAWLAYPLQHPGIKLYTAVAMWGAQTGTGKTLLGETMIRIYGENAQRIGAKQLDSAYNGWAQRKQFIMGDEITGNESRAYADELKGLITGATLRINEKYMPEYDLPNCINFYFNSNHPDAFFLDDHDRRFFVLEAPDTRLPADFYHEYHTWLHGAGPAALHAYLLQVDLKDFDPRAPAPRTNAHEIMVESSRSDVGSFVAMVLHDPEQAKRVYKVPDTVDLFSARELRVYYDPRKETRVTDKTISMELQKQGAVKVLGGNQIGLSGGRVRLYAVRNLPRWRKSTSLKEVKSVLSQRQMTSAKF